MLRLHLGPLTVRVPDRWARRIQRLRLTYWRPGTFELELRPVLDMLRSGEHIGRRDGVPGY